ncbi:MAG TPA: class I lanthipeptide [Flavobacterium sp.]|jgi:bacteriocin-like protein|nr:class I lanthipeptide [Flavobacterium sp.]
MKKQNASKLAFNKASVTELNDSMLKSINGGADIIAQDGSTIIGGPTCSGCVCVPITIKMTRTVIEF